MISNKSLTLSQNYLLLLHLGLVFICLIPIAVKEEWNFLKEVELLIIQQTSIELPNKQIKESIGMMFLLLEEDLEEQSKTIQLSLKNLEEHPNDLMRVDLR